MLRQIFRIKKILSAAQPTDRKLYITEFCAILPESEEEP
jgi:hypothetical protein